MSELGSIKGEVSFDTTKADEALGRVETRASKMAASVVKAGETADKGIASIGKSASASAEKVDSAARNMIGSIQRTTAAMNAGSKSSADYYRALAAQRGVDPRVLEPYLKQLDVAASGAKKATVELQGMERAARGLGQALGSLGVLAVAAFGINAVSSAAALGDKLDDLSEKTGITVRDLSVLRYAGEVTGTSFDAVAVGVRKLSQNMAAAAGGSKEQIAAFAALGVSVKGLDGNLRGSDKVLGDIADRFATFSDGPAKAALAIELFGKSGADMIPLLNKGSQGIAELRIEGERLGAVFGGELAEQSAEFNDNLKRIALSSEAARVQLVGQFIPTLNELAKAFIETKDGTDSFALALGGGFATALQAASILGLNIAFVFSGIGREIGAIAAQSAALARLDFSGFTAISQAVREDGERARKELEALERRILGLRDVGGGRGLFVDPRILGPVDTVAEQARRLRGNAPVIEKPASGGGASASKVNRELEDRARLLAELAGLTGTFAKDWENLSRAFKDGDISLDQLIAAQDVLLSKQPAIRAMRDAEAKSLEETRKAYAQYVQGLRDSERNAEVEINTRVATAKAEAEAYGLLGSQVAMLTLARLEDARTAAALAGEDLESLDRRIKKQRELIGLLQGAEVRDANVKAAKEVQAEWERTTEQISQSLTDALLRGFEDGKGFAENFRDTLTNMFKTLVLRPIIQGILAPVTGSITGLSGGGTAGGAAGSISNLTSVAGAVGQFATGATAGASTASLIGANAVGAVGGDAIGALAALNGGWAGVGTAGAASAAASIASFAAVAGPLALGVIALSGILSKQGETRSGGTYDRLSFVEGPSGGEIGGEAARTAISGTMASINATLKALGSTATLNGFLSGLESSEKGKGFAFAGGSLSTGENFGQFNRTLGVDNRRGSMTPEQANAAFADELKQATLQALQAADVPGMLGDYLRQLGDIDALSGGALDAALNRINTALTQRTALEARYFDITATEAQKLAKARDAEREATDAFSKALLESIYAREDVVKAVAGARNVLAESYETEKRALETTRDRVLGFSKTLKGFTDGLLIGNLSPLTPAQRYAELGSRYTILKAQASAGDANAREKFPEVAQQFLEASRTLNASGANYQADFARVLADSEGMQSIASKQYDASVAALSKLDLQVAGLIDIKGAVMTVAEAIYALAGAGGGQTIDPIQKLYSELLGRSPDAEGGAYFRSKLAVGVSEATIRQDIMNSPEYKRLRGIPLATGIDTVPFDGFRATLHAEETVLNRDAARAWRAGMSGGDSGALVAEVSALRKEVAELRKENRADALAVAQSHAIAVGQSAEIIVNGTKGAVKDAAWERSNVPALA